MGDSNKTLNGSRINRRQVLYYGLAGMAGIAGGIVPALVLGILA